MQALTPPAPASAPASAPAPAPEPPTSVTSKTATLAYIDEEDEEKSEDYLE